MPIDSRRGQPPSSAHRPGGPSAPANLPEAAVDETGNEDPGAELTELPDHEQQEKAGTPPRERDGQAGRERTIGNHPVDPNSMPSRIGLPVGVDRETAADPGNQTPDAPETDNRS